MSDWMTVDQARIDLFSRATDAHQWIHDDQERAATGPFGTTIAHGYLTLSLLPALTRSIELPVDRPRLTVNYGLDRVRFPAPLPAGGRIRGRVRLEEVVPVAGGIQIVREVEVELEGGAKPVMVARTVTRLLD